MKWDHLIVESDSRLRQLERRLAQSPTDDALKQLITTAKRYGQNVWVGSTGSKFSPILVHQILEFADWDALPIVVRENWKSEISSNPDVKNRTAYMLDTWATANRNQPMAWWSLKEFIARKPPFVVVVAPDRDTAGEKLASI